MARYYESKTPHWQRWTIWIIAIALMVGTVAGAIFMIVATQNPKVDPNQIVQDQQQKLMDDFNAKTKVQQKKVDAQNAELSKTYYPILDGYRSRVAKFDSAGIGDVKTDDLKTGDGAEITADNGADYAMYYIGWQPNGTMFDSSFNDNSQMLKSPLAGSGQYISGWNEGVIGMKIGGIREITIPADKAYGTTGSGCDDKGQNCSIAPDTPLKFVVLAVPAPAAIAYPKGTEAACEKAYASQAAQYGMTAQQLCTMYGYGNEEK